TAPHGFATVVQVPSPDAVPAGRAVPRSVRPMLVGGDIGAYATARAFHEAYGVGSVVLAGVQVGAVAHSRVVDLRIHSDLDDPEQLVHVLLEVIAEDPDAT